MGADRSRSGGSITEADLETLERFADQVALALEIAQLHEKTLERERLEQELHTARTIQIGLMPQEQREVFAKFYRAENELTRGIEGTGLGLAISQSIVEQCGGKIWVQSDWQKGSTFSFSVPREQQE